VIVESI